MIYRTRFVSSVILGFGLFFHGCSEPKETHTPVISEKVFGSTADITAAEARAFLDSDKSISYLDVRTVKEFETARPARSSNIPFLVFDENGNRAKNADFLKIVEANFEKGAKLVVGCQSGGRSKMAQGVLKEAGFTSAVNMLGGFGGKRSAIGTMKYEGWSQLEFPTESGPCEDRGYFAHKAKVGG